MGGPALDQIRNYARGHGLRALLGRAFMRSPPPADGQRPPPTHWVCPAAYCAIKGIPIVETGPLKSPAALAAVRALGPDLAIHADAGILRYDLLKIPRLGTVNVHMGILARYRGMNVAEWAALNGDPVGCSVHLVDEGIDIVSTGVLPPRRGQAPGERHQYFRMHRDIAAVL